MRVGRREIQCDVIGAFCGGRFRWFRFSLVLITGAKDNSPRRFWRCAHPLLLQPEELPLADRHGAAAAASHQPRCARICRRGRPNTQGRGHI